MTSPRLLTGFGLIEVLITLVIIAVGLLGISAVQLRATQAEMESYQRAQAMLLLDDIVNRMRTNSAALSCYVLADIGYDNVGTNVDFAETGCNTRADADIAAWHNLLLGAAETLEDETKVGAMLGARGCITYDAGANTYTVAVAWQGLGNTLAPTNICGADQYTDELRRRVATATFRVGSLVAP